MTYFELKEKQQKEVDAFPLFFAFSNKQFAEGMNKLGLEPTEKDKVYKLGNTGGFYRRTDAEALHAMFTRHDNEMNEAIRADTTGEGFIFSMFDYELANHEYTYTGSLIDTLMALGLTHDGVQKNKALKHGLEKAMRHQWEQEEWK